MSDLVIVMLAVVFQPGSRLLHCRLHCFVMFPFCRLGLVLVDFVSTVGCLPALIDIFNAGPVVCLPHLRRSSRLPLCFPCGSVRSVLFLVSVEISRFICFFNFSAFTCFFRCVSIAYFTCLGRAWAAWTSSSDVLDGQVLLVIVGIVPFTYGCASRWHPFLPVCGLRFVCLLFRADGTRIFARLVMLFIHYSPYLPLPLFGFHVSPLHHPCFMLFCFLSFC